MTETNGNIMKIIRYTIPIITILILFYNGYQAYNSFYKQYLGVNAGWFAIQVPYRWISAKHENCNYLMIDKNHTPDNKGPKILYIKGHQHSGKMEVMLNLKDCKGGYIDKPTECYSEGDGKMLIVSPDGAVTRLRYIDFKNDIEKGHVSESGMVNCTLVFDEYTEGKESTKSDSNFIYKITAEGKRDKSSNRLNRLKIFTEYEYNDRIISWIFITTIAVLFLIITVIALVRYELTRQIFRTFGKFICDKRRCKS